MALVLGLEVGDVVDIAENWLAVLAVDSCNRATLITEGGQKIVISSKQMTEMVPEVWVGISLDSPPSRFRLRVEAPTHVSIRRRQG